MSQMIEQLRGSGQTTRAMREAPKNAVYVWCNSVLLYPRRLAAAIGRSDLQIEMPSFLSERAFGRNYSGIVMDHATWKMATSEQIAIYMKLEQYIKKSA